MKDLTDYYPDLPLYEPTLMELVAAKLRSAAVKDWPNFRGPLLTMAEQLSELAQAMNDELNATPISELLLK
jgi:hypothetical protein